MTAIQSGELLDQIFPTKLSRTDHTVTFTNALVNFKINLVKPPEKNHHIFFDYQLHFFTKSSEVKCKQLLIFPLKGGLDVYHLHPYSVVLDKEI